MLPIALQQDEAKISEAPATPPSTAGMTTKVVKGSLWTLAGQVAPLGASLIATPFTIRLLGSEGYGVLILITLIPTYLGFADMGMSIASTKFGSEAYAAGDPEREARTVRTAALIALCAAIPVAIVVFFASAKLVTLFNVPEHLLWEASMALKVAAVTFVVNFMNQIFNTPQLDRLRMDLNTFVTSGFRILGVIATPIVIYLGFGILGAVTVLLVAALLTLAGHIYTSGRLLPELYSLTLDRTIIRPLLKFGGPLALAAVASLTLLNAEKGILPMLVSVEMLAYYSVAFTFASMAIMFGNSLVQSLVPSFSQLWSTGRNPELEELFLRAVFLNLIVLVPGLVVLAVASRTFFSAWAGPSFGENSTHPFFILLGGLLFIIPSYVPFSLLLSMGKSNLFAKLYLIELIPYFVMLYFLTRAFGILGAAAAWAILGTFNGLFYFRLTLPTMELSASLPTERIKWLLIAVLTLVPGLGAFSVLGMSKVTVATVGSTLAVYGVIVGFKVLTLHERTWLLKKLPFWA
ncbi:MAG: polysaccharide biosynthesis protein [Acidobacteria bacterium OLB17]|nr:MAG: polysaccharide biosynthesis protein [Acidobacteria bacterium OLB17]MCZ2390292.1 oligosaccharide flippase family protein [Acidobacteriota bacterium]